MAPKATLTVKPLAPKVVTGEVLLVEVRVKNDGDTPIDVRSHHDRSPCTYALISTAPGGPRYALSADRAAIAMARGRARSQVPYKPGKPFSLQPGRMLPRQDDLASFADKPLEPGEYKLIASAPVEGSVLSSAPVSIEILRPVVAASASLVCPFAAQLDDVLAVTGAPAPAILQRDTGTRIPTHCGFHRIHSLGEGDHVTDVAAFVKTETGYGARWAAWFLEKGKKLGAVLGNLGSVTLGPFEIATDLSGARFVGPGFQHEDGTGHVLVAGLAGGRLVLRSYDLLVDRMELRWESPLDGPAPDARWTARHADDGGARVVWEDTRATPAIVARDYDARGLAAPVGPRRVLALPGRLLAWTVPATTLGDGVVHALVGPVDGRLEHLAAALDGDGTAVLTGTLPTPPGPAHAYALVSPLSGPARVAAATDDGVLACEVGGVGWRVVAAGAKSVQGLHAFSVGGLALWASWVDATRGARLEEIARI